MGEMKHCEKHGDYAVEVASVAGRTISIGGCVKCREERDEADKAREAEAKLLRRQVLIANLDSHSGIPARFRGRTMENYRAESQEQQRALKIARAYAETFAERQEAGGGLVFCGRPGTGKTHLACAIGQALIQDACSVRYSTVIAAIRRVKECYRKDAEKTEQEVIDGFCQPALLILDEAGVQFGTDAEKLILFEILNSRYEELQPTILISNLTEAELSDYIGARIMDRMREGGGAVVAFTWDSYRGRVANDEALGQKIGASEIWRKKPAFRGAL